ncbi:hypothetical protein Tco_1254068 [Tanacetum coccineum]
MTDMKRESSENKFVPNDMTDYYSEIKRITVDGKNANELKGKFMNDLHNNAFDGSSKKNAVEHIEYYLRIINPIKLPNVSQDKLRISVFPISLTGDVQLWFERTKESITCWDDLTEKFLNKYNPPSCIEKNTINLDEEVDDEIGYDPTDVKFIEWLRSKFFNYRTIDLYTMKALWIYWIRGYDEVELTDEEESDNEDEVAEVFRIDTDIFNYETPICSAFNEFNYLLKVDSDLFTKDIEGFKTFDDFKNDWIYEWNKDVPWVDEKP